MPGAVKQTGPLVPKALGEAREKLVPGSWRKDRTLRRSVAMLIVLVSSRVEEGKRGAEQILKAREDEKGKGRTERED